MNLKELTQALPLLPKRRTLGITQSWRGPIRVLHFAGDLDLKTLAKAKKVLSEVLEEQAAQEPRPRSGKGGKGGRSRAEKAIQAAPPQLVIDLKDVQYIDSSGLGFFIGSLKKIKEQKGNLKLASLNAYMLGIFRLINMHYIIDIFDDLEKAVTSFGSPNRRLGPSDDGACKE
ncbi:MAG: STAS domain-containing protein [Candidatus Riflebacteria bacterium]|nr:STAS domain-containing protein [Candidatus Riflebacteria bacterium]